MAKGKGRKTQRLGTIPGMEQVRYQAGNLHYGMAVSARQGAGAWSSEGDYDRKRVRKETRRLLQSAKGGETDPDYGRDA